MDHIRESMESLRQRSGESLRMFNRKFRDLSELAFPLDRRTEDQIKQLIRFYIKTLNSRDIARAVLCSSPSSLTDAMSTAFDSDEVEDALQRLGHRIEEPMDVSAAAPPQTTLSKQLERLTTKIAKVEIQVHQNASKRGPQRFWEQENMDV